MSTLHVNARQIRTDKYNSLLMMSLLLPDARSRGTRAAVHRSVAEMEGEEQGWVTIPRSFPASQKSPFFLIRCLMLIVNLLLYSTLLRKLVVRVTACFSVKGMEFGVPPPPASHFIDTVWLSTPSDHPPFLLRPLHLSFCLLGEVFSSLPHSVLRPSSSKKVDFISSLHFFCIYDHFKI